ncbi:sugar transferase [Alysiella crassa]|uniref:Colanic biosynthesis UDP-glucose lipid carrier transferase n=1 Tax=Alysiella crassa TaxID=153491 RepID=A0A376BT50_9NEIS|nr:sugar transferase [Alysiella crassa]SSY80069.1 Putative colanic biosynthesis UDP-glucose lipid carrier transferase [Alysiella crassa]
MLKLKYTQLQMKIWVSPIICAILPYFILFLTISKYSGYAYIISMLTVGLAHYFTTKSISAITKHPGQKSALSIVPNSLFWFTMVWVALRVFGLPYSVWYLGLGWLLSIAFSYLDFRIQTRKTTVLAYIPFGRAKTAHILPETEWICLTEPFAPNHLIDGYVTDLRSSELTSEWQKFLAQQILKGISVYHIRQMEEVLTGRVKITHFSENELGSLLPSQNYMNIKHILDCILIILSLPITLPLVLIVSILIKLEDGGSIIYTQPRIGYRGKTITVYKLRSMKENNQESITTSDDDRITKIGKIIRKTRIDELPQFINVLKGEMSLIGPRAEFKTFAEELEQQVPFYNYRHIVKPGISGWAQVMHGYATGTEETQVKIEYDFYYIKHFSFSLDVLIFFKTIKTILTGFGAR